MPQVIENVEKVSFIRESGIRKPQIRILKVLAKLEHPKSINADKLAERSHVARTAVVGKVGSSTPEARKSIEEYRGYKSLMTLGWATDVMVPTEDGKERCFRITAEGRKALKKILAEGY